MLRLLVVVLILFILFALFFYRFGDKISKLLASISRIMNMSKIAQTLQNPNVQMTAALKLKNDLETPSNLPKQIVEEADTNIKFPKPYLKHSLYDGDYTLFSGGMREVNVCEEGHIERNGECVRVSTTSKLGICMEGSCFGLK